MRGSRPVLLATVVIVGWSSCAPGPGGAAGSQAHVGPRHIVLSILGTNDLHGHVERLPVFAGYVSIVRQVRAGDGGVLLVDAGDMFQGTLESNLDEGATVIECYNAMGYAAAAVGNHEFDFGPVGPEVTVNEPGGDPQGALKARAAQARFPFLMANVVGASGARPRWLNVAPSAVVSVAGVRVGLIGVTTLTTPRATMPANFASLAMLPLADAVAAQARALRRGGAVVVVVAAHAGGSCRSFRDPTNLSSCELDDEIFQMARALPAGLVDVIVAGHHHRGIAHEVAGIAIIESYARGRAFGRVDVVVDLAQGRVASRRIHPPQRLCSRPAAGDQDCRPGVYEGRPVLADPGVAAVVRRAVARAAPRRDESLHVEVTSPIWRSRVTESPLGNLVTDLMLAARPGADLAVTNGGGLRAHLPAGMLSYGRLYEALPFDNRFATVRLVGAEVRRLFAANLQNESGILSLAGLRVEATCRLGELHVELVRPDGRVVADDEPLVLLTSDFLATGGDQVLTDLSRAAGGVSVESGEPIRDAVAELLRRRGGRLSGREPGLYDPGQRRLLYPGRRPVTCP